MDGNLVWVWQWKDFLVHIFLKLEQVFWEGDVFSVGFGWWVLEGSMRFVFFFGKVGSLVGVVGIRWAEQHIPWWMECFTMSWWVDWFFSREVRFISKPMFFSGNKLWKSCKSTSNPPWNTFFWKHCWYFEKMACLKRHFFWESTIKHVKHNDSCWAYFNNKTNIPQFSVSKKWKC